LQKNKLIYAFQPNIVKNQKYSKYLDWFELAEKTQNKLNEKNWFDKYLKDEIFAEIIKRINTEKFEQADWDYINNQSDFIEKVKRFEQVFIDEGFELGMEKGIEKGIENGIEKGIKKGIEKGVFETVKNGIKAGLSNEIIKIMSKLSDQQIDSIRTGLKK